MDIPETYNGAGAVLGVRIEGRRKLACLSLYNSWSAIVDSLEGLILQSPLTIGYCEALHDSDVFSITLNVTKNLVSYDIVCTYYTEDGEIQNKSISLPALKGRLHILVLTILKLVCYNEWIYFLPNEPQRLHMTLEHSQGMCLQTIIELLDLWRKYILVCRNCKVLEQC